jgi:hypothetical protein
MLDYNSFITAVVRCLADGDAMIGYLRRDGGKIHRRTEDENKEVLRPPQESLDLREEAKWREDFAIDYAL